MEKVLNLLLITIIIMSLLVGCTDNDNNTPANSSPKKIQMRKQKILILIKL